MWWGKLSESELVQEERPELSEEDFINLIHFIITTWSNDKPVFSGFCSLIYEAFSDTVW